MKILITGGMGYLGGRIAVCLSQYPEFKVRLGSRKIHPPPSWLQEADTVAMDVSEPHSLVDAVAGVDAVVHLAAMNENECANDPANAVKINTLGTLNVLNAAIAAGAKRFVYFSTAHVYGAPLTGDITESKPTRPTHPYAITHRAAEDFVLAAHEQNRITGIVIRLSNGFGAPTHPNVDRWTLLVNDLCHQAVNSCKMVLRSSGLQQRDFITLTDVGRAVQHLLKLPQIACDDGLFNLGGNCSMSIWEMTQLIAARCQVVLKYTPKILCPEPSEGQLFAKLNYNCNKLFIKNFMLKGKINDEIDGTLQLCRSTWG